MESIDQLRIMMIFYGSPCNKHLVITTDNFNPDLLLVNHIHQKIIEKDKTIFQRLLTFFNERTKNLMSKIFKLLGIDR